jgi:hypothetical protein
MCKKLIFLISFVLAASLAGNALADDLEVPPFAGCDQTCAALWEFDVEPPEASDYMYFAEVADPCITQDDVDCIGTGFTWNEGAQTLSVADTELNFYMTLPDGTGTSITVYCQVTYTGAELDVFPMLEIWDGLRCEDGEYLDGAEGPEDLDFYEAVEIEPGVWHQTSSHTFDMSEEPVYVSALLAVTDEFDGSGSSDIIQIVLDAVIHDGTPPEGCPQPGRPFGAGGVSNASPEDGADHVAVDVNLSFQAPFNALCLWEDDPCDPNDKPPDPNLKGPLKYDVYFGTEPNVLTMTQLADDYSPTNCNDVMVFDPCVGGDLSFGIRYYWRVDFNDLDPGDPNFYEGPYFAFRTLGFADNPYPSDGGTGEATTDLRWAGDSYADSFDVYFGTDETAVGDATTSSDEYKGGSTGTWTDPCDANIVRNVYGNLPLLDLSKTYYWRIDEVNTTMAAAIKGDIWSFSTEAHLDLEDFDSYASTEDLYTVWNDYWVNDSDAEIGLMKNPDYVQSGYALQLDYENTSKSIGNYVGSFTDADVADLEGGTDWTVSGIKALVLHFLGQPGNQATANEKMWVEIEDTSSNVGLVLYDGDPNDVQVPSWHEWNVDLGIFDACGVTLSAVSKIRIGFGGEIRTGQSAASLDPSTVYFDELELHPIRCVPAVSWPYGDIDGDCNVGGYDLEAMSADWLVKDYEVIPVPPDRNNLLVEYLFDTDGNYNDTSGSGLHGQPTASLTSVAGGYLTIENTGGYVEIPFGESNPFHGPTDFSIFINYRSDTIAVTGLMTSTDPCLPTDWDDPNVVDIDEVFTTYSPMAVIVDQAHTGSSSAPDDITFYYDNWFKGGTNVAKSEIGGIGSWHSVAVTYDADGGTCPDEPWDPNACPPGSVTGLFTVYIDGTKGPDPANYDPNIPVDANHDIVRIGDGYNPLHPEDWGFTTHIGDINEILIYDVALTEGEVYYLSGITDPTYVANTSVANVVPKSPPGGPYDANNMDIINFLDYEKLAERWLTGPYLWP